MPDDIGYLKYQKQIHELKVGKAMFEWYGKEKRLLNTMRQVVVYSFLRYFELIGLDPWMGASPPSPPSNFPCYVNLLGILPDSKKGVVMKKKTNTLEVIKKLLKKEKFLMVWGKYCSGTPGELHPRALGEVFIKYPEWSVSDCSELVRFWGGIVEEIGDALVKNKLGNELNTGAAAEIALRLDDIRKRAKGGSKEFERRAKEGWHQGRGELLTIRRLRMQREAHRSLKDGQDGVRDRQYYYARKTPMWMRDYVFPGDIPAKKTDDSDKWVRGCSLLKPVNASLVKHLDAVFGLWEGADISGTTTDFVGCFEAAWMMVFDGVLAADNSPANLNAALEVMTWCFPYFALLAPSAMVYGYHHTMYEIGVALSLAYGVDYGDRKKPVFDYYIGSYESIVPNISHATGTVTGGHKNHSGTKVAEWTVGQTNKIDGKVMARGRAEEARLKKTLTAAIKSVESKKDAFNPCVVSLIDDKGVVYGGYLLNKSEWETHKAWFQSVYVHRQSLSHGAHGYSEYLLKKIDPGYKDKFASKDAAYFKKYSGSLK